MKLNDTFSYLILILSLESPTRLGLLRVEIFHVVVSFLFIFNNIPKIIQSIMIEETSTLDINLVFH